MAHIPKHENICIVPSLKWPVMAMVAIVKNVKMTTMSHHNMDSEGSLIYVFEPLCMLVGVKT